MYNERDKTKESVPFYPMCTNCLERVETIDVSLLQKALMFEFKLYREAHRDGHFKQSASHGSWGVTSTISAKNDAFWKGQNMP